MLLIVSREKLNVVQVRTVHVHFRYGEIPAGKARGTLGYFALLDSNDPGISEAVSVLRAMPDHYDVVGEVDAPKEAKSETEQVSTIIPADKVPLPVRQAFGQGWRLEDMEGAGREERWGDEGGRGSRTGLTLLELAMCLPPPSWSSPDWVKEHYPWEDLAFASPFPDWRPPCVSPKVQAPAAPVIEAPPADVISETPDIAPKRRGRPPKNPQGPPAQDELQAAILAYPEIDALTDYGSTEVIASAVGIMAANNGASYSKCVFLLDRVNLPKPTEAHVIHFRAILKTTE
jgi:hypothetical protein